MKGGVSAPRGWVWSKVKYVADFYTGWTPSTGNKEFFEGSNLWANISDLGPKILYDTAKQISDKAVKQADINISPEGSLLFSFKLSIGQVSFAGRSMYTNEAIATFPPQSGFNAKWAYWALPVFVPLNADENIYGAKLLNQELIRSAHILVPSPGEQTRIANFLDEQTARIDALIAEKERLDALLGEYRGSLISAAVMGQLSTAIVSAGRVGGGVKPASWRKLSLKRVAEIMPSNVDKHSVEGELPVRLCNYVDVYNNDRIDDSIDFMVATASEAQITRFTLKAQDVLVTKDSEEPSDIGIPAYVPQDMPGVVCGYHLAVLRPDLMQVHGAFLHWALQSTEVQAYYETAALGISRYALGINDLGMTPLHLPDRAEQTRIANFLDEQTTRIDDLRNHCREHIALLREYRFSLISAAVTGQLDIDAFGRQVA